VIDIRTLIIPGVFFLISCSSQMDSQQPKEKGTPEATVYQYLALGDSYTIGEGIDPAERYPVQLADSLRSGEFDIREPVIIARTGWTTDELDKGMTAVALPDTFHMVSLLIGVNNQYRGRSLDEYRLQFRNLLNRAITLARGDSRRVMVLSIPDWGVTPYASRFDRNKIAQQINQFNSVNKEETLKTQAHYIDITPVSRKAANDLTLLAVDGLHPSGKMYREWMRLAFPAAVSILQLPFF
jgi:lysophospholipase L1-like esterase